MEKLCKNCYHWKESHGNVCTYDPPWQRGANLSDTMDIEATALDDTGLEYDLITGPNFGCVQFKEKNKTQKETP